MPDDRGLEGPAAALVEEARQSLERAAYRSAASLSAHLIERAFREAVRNGLRAFDHSFRQKFFRVEEEVGKGRGFEEFTLGQLVRLLRGTSFLAKWAESTGRSLRGLSVIDLDAVTKLRNAVVHAGHEVTRTEAELLFTSTQVIVESLGLLDPGDAVAAETRGALVELSDPSEGPRRPVRREEGSRYEPQRGREYDRLQIQADRALGLDTTMIRHGLHRIGRDRLAVLDVGCADGRITASRFDGVKEVDLALGIDKSEFLLERARARASDRLVFRQIDVEAVTFDQQVGALLADIGRDHFDLVFVAVTLHHLANPIRLLRTLRRFLADDGCVIVRAKDDGARLTYPDHYDRATRLIEKTARSPGAADRASGRKLLWQLRRAGLCDIQLFPAVYHTVGMLREERHQLFLESFAFRRNYLAQVVERDPEASDLEAERQLREVDEDLGELELDFEDDNFFYLEMAFGFVAFE